MSCVGDARDGFPLDSHIHSSLFGNGSVLRRPNTSASDSGMFTSEYRRSSSSSTVSARFDPPTGTLSSKFRRESRSDGDWNVRLSVGRRVPLYAGENAVDAGEAEG